MKMPGAPSDHFSAPKQVTCKCGCGHTFPRIYTNRYRKFAPDCPTAETRLKEAQARDGKRYRERKEAKAILEGRKKRGQAAPRTDECSIKEATARPRVRMCKICCNLPHVRPEGGLCVDVVRTIKGRFAEREVLIKGCGLPWQGTPSLPNHELLSKMPENVERKW